MTWWFISYLGHALFWLWIVRWGGAELIEGKIISAFVVYWWAPTWTAEGIKVFGCGAFIASTVLFVLGLFLPAFRFFDFV